MTSQMSAYHSGSAYSLDWVIAHQIAARGHDAEEVVADQHEPGAELVGQARARRALQDVEGCGDQRVAAESEDDAAGVDRPQAAEACPCGVEGEFRPCQQRGDPHADEHGDDRPDHGQHDADLGGVVVVALELGRIGQRRIPFGDDEATQRQGEEKDDEALGAEQFAAARSRHGKPYRSHDEGYKEANLPLGHSQFGHAGACLCVDETPVVGSPYK